MTIMTVGQAAKELNIRPQVINGFVRKAEGPLDWVVSERPRKIDLELYKEWVAQRASTPRKRSSKSADGSQGPALAENNPLAMSIKERKLFAWSRGEGRGWALAQPDEETMALNSDYLQLQNHLGEMHVTSFRRLLHEQDEGKLFFLDLEMAIALILGQVDTLNTECNSEDTETAVEHLIAALAAVERIKDTRQPVDLDMNKLGEEELEK